MLQGQELCRTFPYTAMPDPAGEERYMKAYLCSAPRPSLNCVVFQFPNEAISLSRDSLLMAAGNVCSNNHDHEKNPKLSMWFTLSIY